MTGMELLSGQPPRCIQCGKFDPRVLQLDHINGGGGKQRETFGPRQQLKYYYIHQHLACVNQL